MPHPKFHKIFLIIFSSLFFTLPAFAEAVIVERVIDGDTLKLSDGRKIRLLAVDTPETVHPFKPVQCYGPEAKEFTKHQIEGKAVLLIHDPGNKKDKYGRELAWVYRAADMYFLNLHLVKHGLARAYLRYPTSKNEEFFLAEKYAKDHSFGLWKACQD